MSRKKGRKNLPVSIVKPAPGDLRIVQEFLNTADFRKETEELRSPWDLADWLAARELAPAATRLVKKDLEDALEVREGLRALAAANNGAALDVDAVERLDRVLGRVSFRLAFGVAGRGRYVPEVERCEEALTRIAAIVAEAQIEGVWRRFKACAHDVCRGAFFDFSTSRSGKWCSMRRCGNQLKSLAYRGRRRE